MTVLSRQMVIIIYLAIFHCFKFIRSYKRWCEDCSLQIFVGCSTTRVTAHSLGRPVFGQTKPGILKCIAINKKGDDRRAVLKNAQRALSKVMRGKEEAAAGKKRKQAVMDEILTPCPVKSAESSMKDSQKSGPNGCKDCVLFL